MRIVRIDTLPGDALDAAAAFRAALEPIAHDTLFELPAAPVDHDDWRRTAARDLARAHAPARVVIMAGGGPAERTEAERYFAQAPGVTGQFFRLSDDG